MNPEDLVVVYSTGELHKIQIIKGLLEENGIPAFILNYSDSSRLQPESSDLYVKAEDAMKARHLIAKNHNE